MPQKKVKRGKVSSAREKQREVDCHLHFPLLRHLLHDCRYEPLIPPRAALLSLLTENRAE